MAIKSNSRFKYTDTIDYDGVTTFGLWNKPSFFENSPSSKYIVRSNVAGRPDLISDQVYGTPELFWVVIAFNSPREPFNWPKAGDTILIPDATFVFGQL